MELFKLTHKAKNDLIQIAVYTEEHWSKNQRNIYIKQFDDIFHLLADNYKLGKRCDYIKQATEKFLKAVILFFIK